jgi:CheY-like chemotaxis protein
MERKKILIVDDESSIRNMIVWLLKPYNFQTEIAENGRQAIDHLEKTSFDLIITDYCMPEMDGLQLMRLIKLRSSDTPVLIMTGTESICDLLEKEGAAFLLKPFRAFELKTMIGNMLNGI